jgi:hypothetical protein
VVEELAAVASSVRLRLVEDGVGFEPTEPLRTGEPEGPPECKSDALSRSATRPVSLSISPLRRMPGGLFVNECPSLSTFLCPRNQIIKSPQKCARMVAFRCYSRTSAGGRHDDAWRAAVPTEFNGEVDAELELLQQHRTLEDKQYFKPLHGKCAGLTQVRIEFELELDDPRSQHESMHRRKGRRRSERPKIIIRILGFGTADDFALLYGFRKYGEPDYDPACHSALNRKSRVEHDDRRARPCRFA